MKNYTLGNLYGAIAVFFFCVFLSVVVNSCAEKPQHELDRLKLEEIKRSQTEPTFTHIRVFNYQGCEYLTNTVVGGLTHSMTCPNRLHHTSNH